MINWRNLAYKFKWGQLSIQLHYQSHSTTLHTLALANFDPNRSCKAAYIFHTCARTQRSAKNPGLVVKSAPDFIGPAQMHATRASRGVVCSWCGLGVDLPQFSFHECTLFCVAHPDACRTWVGSGIESSQYELGVGQKSSHSADNPTLACPKSSFLMFNARIVL